MTDLAAPRPAGVSLVRPRPVADPTLRLFLLHHAAGSHLAYTAWAPLFPEDWDVCLLEAPGRGTLGHLPPYESAPELAGFFLDDVEGLLDVPFALFGHSMGGLVAYEMTVQLAARGLPAPVWLGVSACEAPYGEHLPDQIRLHTLPAPELRTALAEMGGLPSALLEDEDVWAVFEPRVRADFAVTERWRPHPGAAGRVSVPLSLFGGEDDTVVPVDALTAWADGAERLVGQHLFPGGHFYFQGQEASLVAQLELELDGLLPRAPRTRAGQRAAGPVRW
ncbi:alpha/beta fold hydrolase [Streptomyces sp. NPDC049837]|uniref:thioesterase II family protein n=1 Tax=Streptomyces sp. NPDC049837 TaxID=3155277 RepID=UPI00341729B7